MKTLSNILILILLLGIISPSTSSIYISAHIPIYLDTDTYKYMQNNVITSLCEELELEPQNYSIIRFSPDEKKVTIDHRMGYNFSEKIRDAIVRTPLWMHRALAYQFKHMDNPEVYADLILKSDKRFTDEIAFSIAYSPLKEIPSVEVLEENVEKLYELDKYIQYADVIDFDNHDGNYGSTIKYNILANKSIETRILPSETYYWYIVHPKLLGESAEKIYNSSWRSYLFYHNDIGYPLLKEKIRDIPFLWDEKSYIQYANRIWRECIKEHPTAVEAVSYWIGKTIPFQARGDRPNQPNIIAHEHNGWCGEIQRLAIAALRTVLVPSIGVCNIAEDHVWRAFYDEGWHQNDNWWTDSGGAVDIPMVYAKGWGKHMSSVYTWRGDSIISDVTPTYIPSDDRVKIVFNVKDLGLNPRDGILITSLVKGILDTTWYKNKAKEIIENIWDKIPNILNGRILEKLNETIMRKIEEIPESIKFPLISIWNYTDVNGRCIFNLGKSHEYIFLVQNPDNFIPLSIRFLSKPENKTFNITIPSLSRQYKGNKISTPSGNYDFNISLQTKGFQFQRNLKTMEIGRRECNGKVEWFIVDEKNLERFKNGKPFDYIKHGISYREEINFNGDRENWYIIFYNPNQYTHLLVDIDATMKGDVDESYVNIIKPVPDLFDKPIFNVGDLIDIRGIASHNTTLIVDDKNIILPSGQWEYIWNTSRMKPGEYIIKATSEDAIDSRTVILIDRNPPIINIEKPDLYQITDDPSLTIRGETWDESDVKYTEISIDNLKQRTSLENWTINFNLDNIKPGIHFIEITAVDISDNFYNKSIPIVINDTDNNWKPYINNVSYTPLKPDNKSIIVVYANVTGDKLYPVKKVLIHWIYNSTERIEEMERYADNPPQSRHQEDPLRNQSNKPIYGYELGVFKTGETIEYWIEAWDYAMNKIASDKQIITVQ